MKLTPTTYLIRTWTIRVYLKQPLGKGLALECYVEPKLSKLSFTFQCKELEN